jgi:uncharacterized protein YeaO (DUF488 family)
MCDSSDGYRMLIDRLWPRGISRGKAKLDEWNKDIAPSTELRKKFHQKEEKYEEFAEHYQRELFKNNRQELNRIRGLAKNMRVTLLYASKDTQQNHAVVLMQVLNLEV